MTEPSEDLRLPREALLDMYRQAREEFPSECCGYLFGRSDATEVVRCKNRQDQLHALDPEAHPRTSANAYNIGGKELLTLVRSFETERPVTVIYHSHPEVGAYFSDEDVRAALSAGYPVDYLVIDCQRDRIGGAVLFRRSGERYVELARYEGAEI